MYTITMKTILLISPYWKEEHRWMVSTVKLAELWQRLGYKVVVLCMGKKKIENGEWRIENQNEGQEGNMARGQNNPQPRRRVSDIEKSSETLEIHRVPDWFIPDPWNYGIAFGFSGEAVKLARELKPDVIVVNKVLFWSSISLIRLRLAGLRVLLLTDALVGITWWPRGRIPQICAALYAWTLGWLILKRASSIVFFHPQPEGVLQRLGIAAKSRVIPTGIDPKSYERSALSSEKKGLEAHSSELTATYIGRLESVKGVDDFVAAARTVKKDHPSLRVQVVGWFKEGHPLVAEYQNSVEFSGLRSDIPVVLASTDIFVLPSYSEGLSNALMEAMSSGCACIASDVGGNAFLLQNGVSGFLFPAGDREALASHIRRLVDDPSKRLMLGEQAKKRIHEMFSWEKVGKQYDQLFSSWQS